MNEIEMRRLAWRKINIESNIRWQSNRMKIRKFKIFNRTIEKKREREKNRKQERKNENCREFTWVRELTIIRLNT